MNDDRQGVKRLQNGLMLIAAAACLATVGCSDIHPEGNVEESGMLGSPTDEADQFHEAEEREEK
jgi:hypothetical protein